MGNRKNAQKKKKKKGRPTPRWDKGRRKKQRWFPKESPGRGESQSLGSSGLFCLCLIAATRRQHDYLSSPRQQTKGQNLPSLLYIWGIGVRGEVVVAFYPDVVDVAIVIGRGGSTGAELTGEQVLDVLQPQALGLWEAALDEEETQNHQARVHEERPWRRDSHVHFYCSMLAANIKIKAFAWCVTK